ncbi:MAG: hypothetical protein M3016_06125 [Actinomycetota bacterium]|nr:hypothetical protein [Actinomycetota bacterium]
MSLSGLALIAVGTVLAVLAVVQFITWAAHASFIASVILGDDRRTSTSKTFILMWTVLVAWALVALLIAGEFVPAHACLGGPAAGVAQRCHGDDVALLQIGWIHFLHGGLSGSYLLLLGVPAAAGVAAKGITQARVQGGTGVKPAKAGGGRAPFARIAEIFSADDGSTDIGDFQYVIFNLITGAYFVAQFLKPDGSGLPTIPDTLLGLTSVSAGLYVSKKAVTRTQPAITGVFPAPLRDGQPFTIVGSGLTADPASPTDVEAQVSIDGMLATGVKATGGDLIAIAPANLAPGGSPMTRQLRVMSPYGGLTSDFSVQCQ